MGTETRATPRGAASGHLLTWLFAAVAVIGLMAVTAPAAAAAKASHSSKASSSQAKAFAAFQTCLAKHGVKPAHRPGTSGNFRRPSYNGTPPSGGPPPSGGGFFRGSGSGGGFQRNSKYAKAMAACRSKLPKGFQGRGGGTPFNPTPAQQQALATFRQCLAAHGINISANTNFQTIRSLLQADPAAAKACQSDLNSVFPHRPTGLTHPSTTT